MKLAAGLLALAATASAATFETWQTLEAPLQSRGRTSVILHSQFRERNYFSDVFQGRVGPVFRVTLTPRATLVGGYYYGEVTQTEHHWGNNHRTFGGVEFPTAFAGGVLTPRVVVEHHFGGAGTPSVRFREGVQWSKPVRSMTGFGGTETFTDQHGFIWQRMTAGLRMPLTASYRFEVSYLYDARVERIGESRHVLQAAFRPRRRER